MQVRTHFVKTIMRTRLEEARYLQQYSNLGYLAQLYSAGGGAEASSAWAGWDQSWWGSQADSEHQSDEESNESSEEDSEGEHSNPENIVAEIINDLIENVSEEAPASDQPSGKTCKFPPDCASTSFYRPPYASIDLSKENHEYSIDITDDASNVENVEIVSGENGYSYFQNLEKPGENMVHDGLNELSYLHSVQRSYLQGVMNLHESSTVQYGQVAGVDHHQEMAAHYAQETQSAQVEGCVPIRLIDYSYSQVKQVQTDQEIEFPCYSGSLGSMQATKIIHSSFLKAHFDAKNEMEKENINIPDNDKFDENSTKTEIGGMRFQVKPVVEPMNTKENLAENLSFGQDFAELEIANFSEDSGEPAVSDELVNVDSRTSVDPGFEHEPAEFTNEFGCEQSLTKSKQQSDFEESKEDSNFEPNMTESPGCSGFKQNLEESIEDSGFEQNLEEATEDSGFEQNLIETSSDQDSTENSAYELDPEEGDPERFDQESDSLISSESCEETFSEGEGTSIPGLIIPSAMVGTVPA